MPLKKSLKILVDGYLLNKEPQGTQTHIREIYKEVAKANKQHQFYIAIFDDTQIIEDFSEYNNIKFLSLKNKSRLLRMVYEIPALIRSNNIDFAHFQYVIPLFRSKNCKYIVTIHDILFNEFPDYFSKSYCFKRNFLFKTSAKKSDFLLTVSEYSKQSILSQYDLKNKKIYITPNGVNPEYFTKYNKKEAQQYIVNKYKISKYILYVSRVEPRKNQELLLNSFLNLKLIDKGFQLLFIGKTSIPNRKFEQLLQQLNLAEKENIHYFQEIDQNDLLSFYKASHCFVFPSKAEGFGIPPIEAGALKIPVLCSNTTAMSDFDFFEPFFVNTNDVKSFEVELEKLVNSNNSTQLELIKSTIKQRYSWEKSASIISSILND